MTRLPDWQSRLSAYLHDARGRSFCYGEWDCFQFVRGAVVAMTERDIGSGSRPYHSRFGYLRQMARYCGSVSLEWFAETLFSIQGFHEVQLKMSRRGDVVLVGSDDQAFGIISLDGMSALVLDVTGNVMRVPLSLVVLVWSI
jgi:hypothetical protein